MLVNLRALLVRLIDIVLLRGGPEQLPASSALLAVVVALILRRDLFSAVAGAGTRDPIVAIALAWSVGGPDATAVPLAGAAILGIASAALVIRRR